MVAKTNIQINQELQQVKEALRLTLKELSKYGKVSMGNADSYLKLID